MFVWKRQKINEKEAGYGPFFKNYFNSELFNNVSYEMIQVKSLA